MSLDVLTFSNATGGNVLYKALAHPLAAAPARELGSKLSRHRRVAVYDPLGIAATVAAFVPLGGVSMSGVFVQDARRAGEHILGLRADPIDRFPGAEALLLLAFDAERLRDQIAHLIEPGTRVYTLDALRIPDPWLTHSQPYLQPLNFVTNFAFFRDTGRTHTCLASANYWSGYGAAEPRLHGLLFDRDGHELARFTDPMGPAGAAVVVDSRALRERFGLADFCGQLFLQVAGAAGHDVFTYALDVYGETAAELSCTHDANAWPAERYAGLPLPAPGERVTLWVQNSHPVPIPAGALALRPPDSAPVPLAEEIGPFATRAVDVGAAFPDGGSQVEFIAGKHVVRPRYEIRHREHARIAHLNVLRQDLRPDPEYWKAAEHLGKGFLLPGPLLPPGQFSSEILITPMSDCQDELALLLTAYDRDGTPLGEQRLEPVPPGGQRWVDGGALGGDGAEPGHLELRYDPRARRPLDGWFHAIFRYRDLASGHAAETSFGCHMFNSVVTYKGEPQSYAGPPPGLSTRLFLRLGTPERRTFCQLIYPTSTRWHPRSRTSVILHAAGGEVIEELALEIPVNGSRWLEIEQCFDPASLERAGLGAYAIIRDHRCRLFGYHGLRQDGCFSLDHMFGF